MKRSIVIVKRMKHVNLSLAALAAFFFINLLSRAQVTTTQVTANQAVTGVLVGGGLNVSNISYTGSATALAQYTAFNTNLPIQDGLVISTGNATNPLLNGPPANFCSTSNGTPGDATLATIAGVSTNDAAILQFDFIPSGDTLKFDYVFGSEEYNDFVNGSVNDVFAFLLTGPNPAGGNYTNVNIALLPNSAVPVSINTVNNGNSFGCTGPCNTGVNPNCNYYIDNSCGAPSGIACDGFTVRLTAIAPVIPCQTYTIRLAIADGGDSVYDSWVFFEKNSFSSNSVTITPEYNYTSAPNDTLIYEGCSDVTLTFQRFGNLSQPYTANISIGGTATNGVDYNVGGNPFPNQITFPAGQDSAQLNVSFIADGITEGVETLTLQITTISLCGDTIVAEVTLYINDLLPLVVNAGPDLTRCPGIPYTANATVTGGVPPYSITWTVPGSQGTNPVTLPATTSGWCVVTASEGCGIYTAVKDSFYLTVQPPQFSMSFDVDSLSCFQSADGAIDMTVSGNQAPFTYSWAPLTGGPVGGPTNQDISNLAAGSYTIQVTDANGCILRDTVDVFQPSQMTLTWPPRFICSNTNYVLNAPGGSNPNNIPGVNYSWSPAQYLSDPNSPNPTFNGSTPGPGTQTINFTVTYDSTGACGTSTFTVVLNPEVAVKISPDTDTTAICQGNELTLYNDTMPAPGNPPYVSYNWSNGSSTDTTVTSSQGWLYLTITDNVNCQNTDSIYVVVAQPSTPNLPPTLVLCDGDELLVAIDSSTYNGSDAISWSGVGSGNLPVTTVTQSGQLIVSIENACGTISDTAEVILQKGANPQAMPNVFSPNGDGQNDIYTTTEFTDSEKFSCKIFNRWGKKVFETEDPSIQWQPKNISDGVYFITIFYNNCDGELAKFETTVTIFNR